MRTKTKPSKRRGAAVIWTATSLATLLGFGALALDTGRLYVVKTELQAAADAAAMGAASELGAVGASGSLSQVYLAAQRYAGENLADGRAPKAQNVEATFGQGFLGSGSGKYDFVNGATPPNAVRVTLRLSGDDGVPMLFAPIFGSEDLNRRGVAASATAMLIPRDIAVVADLSASHNDDSELKRYKDTEINLESVWRNLPGGNPETGDGPLWGYLDSLGWGTEVLDASYDPTADSGLVNLQKNQDWNNGWVEGQLGADNYTANEIDALMSADYDSNSGTGAAWPYRVAVAMGWAEWRSGFTNEQGEPQGRYSTLGQSPGNGDQRVDVAELIWSPFPGGISADDQSQTFRKNEWSSYIRSYMDQNNGMTNANQNLKFKFGAKTLTNYLLEIRPLSTQSPDLAQVPTQPMQAVKDAVRLMTEVVEDLDSDDQMSLESYDRWGAHRVNLTYEYDQVADWLDSMQAGQDGYYTNMGDGMQHAIAELTGSRARDTAVKIMVLLTDGRANVNESGGYTDYPGGRQWALDSAEQAVSEAIRIYSVSVGSDADRDLMQEIAQMGSGTEFYAEGSIADYTAQLQQIFETLGGARPVLLIE